MQTINSFLDFFNPRTYTFHWRRLLVLLLTVGSAGFAVLIQLRGFDDAVMYSFVMLVRALTGGILLALLAGLVWLLSWKKVPTGFQVAIASAFNLCLGYIFWGLSDHARSQLGHFLLFSLVGIIAVIVIIVNVISHKNPPNGTYSYRTPTGQRI